MILIVEDDPVSRRALQTVLTTRGYASQGVGSAEEALAALCTLDSGRDGSAARLPEMVLIDVDLPGMSGLQLLQLLRAAYPHLHCMLMSAHHRELLASEDDPDPGTEPATPPFDVPFLPKPLDLQKLLTMVREHA
jgi:CheY-like chemotaxis protein